MEKTRFYKLVILALVLVNVTTLYFYWNSSSPQQSDNHRHPGPPPRKSLVTVLSLTGITKQKVYALEKDHFRVKDSLVGVSRKLHEELFVSFKDPSKDSTAIKQLINHIVENQRETEQMTFDYFKDVEKLCTPAQKKKLQKMIRGALMRINPPPPPPRGRRGHHPHP
jgi:Spy/CpxP family protein refolding chaperone